MYYVRKDLAADAAVNQAVEQPLAQFEGCVTDDRSMAKMAQFQAPRIAPITASDLPGKGDLVAIDAEFVSLQKEEASVEIRKPLLPRIRQRALMRQCSLLLLSLPANARSSDDVIAFEGRNSV